LESLGIGSTILIRGPPEGGFGAIIYNTNSNLSVMTEKGNIIVESGVCIYSSTGSINLETLTSGSIIIKGTISAPEGTVRLWTNVDLDLRQAIIRSKLGGYIHNPYADPAVSWVGVAGGGDGTSWGDPLTGQVVPSRMTIPTIVTIDLGGAAVTTSTDYVIGALSIGATNSCSLSLGGALTLDNAGSLTGNLTIGTTVP